MQRKDFIRRTTLGALLIPLYTIRNSVKHGNLKRVIVIGAGISGAAAARKLADAGCEVIVLEARNRIGGRIHTNKDWGFNIELGANWIHNAYDIENQLMAYANMLSIETHETNYYNINAYDQDGDKISKLRLGLFYNHFEKKLKKQAEKINSNEKDISIQEAIKAIITDENYTERDQNIISLIKESYSNNLAANIDKVSAKYYFSKSVDKKQRDFFVSGGYNQIVTVLLERINVELNSVVHEIRHHTNYVEVITNNKAIEADYVIVTVPLSILQNQEIKFNPSLPEWKINSFHQMKMGLFNKVIMEFTQKFWDGNADFQCYHSEMGNSFGIALNYYRYEEKPILIAMPVDNSGLWIEQNEIDTIKTAYQNMLHKAHPGKEIEFKNIMVTKWNAEEFSKGSYSYVPVDATERDFEALTKEIGRVHFAGEATNIKYHATVHGAYNSGIREALKIINA
jgi:monoamine oxidase